MHPGMTRRHQVLVFATILLLHTTINAAPNITNYTSIQTPISTGTCESRSINYVTVLPNFESVCYRQRRSDASAAPPSSLTINGEQTASIPDSTTTVETVISNTSGGSEASTQTDIPEAVLTTGSATESIASHETDDVFSDASFLSFEDWKKQIMEKSQDALDNVKDGERRRKPEGNQETLDSLGDDHEIDIDFGAFLGDNRDNKTQQPKDDDKTSKQTQDEQAGDKPKKPRHRSKDAGKTCKERTNFASFDSGAQVMKANREAKSTSALLSENRDAYMLNTCSAKNKFVIVELSDSILVETVALANFEFFSSTFRGFRVSVSDRYPMKLDRWVELGTFEAKNSREIQAFLIEDPRIWARYLRIEFLSQYGNEFYCPVSLLRVHGRTMIQDILSLDQSTGADDEDEVEENLHESEGEKLVPEAVAEAVKVEEKVAEGLKEAQATLDELIKTAESIISEQTEDDTHSSRILEAQHLLQNASTQLLTSPWNQHGTKLEHLFDELQKGDMCYPSENPALMRPIAGAVANTTTPIHSPASQSIIVTDIQATPNTIITPSPTRDASQPTVGQNLTDVPSPKITPTPAVEIKSQSAQNISDQTASVNSSGIAAANNSTPQVTNKTSSTSSAHSSQPTTQESFFKNVSKRLQLLEQNSTLSLKYIEEQSRHLREAFNKVEKRQLSKTTSFLENLNATVLAELRQFGEQYDQIWQSTVFELESQKDLLRRETAALSSRLTLLADELVFQKRMAIVQSVLLLLCLGLVLFSRYLPGGIILPQTHNINSKRGLDHSFDNVPSSPLQHRTSTSPRQRRMWRGMGHRNQRSGDSHTSMRSHSQLDSPPTTFSSFSEAEDEDEYKAYGVEYMHSPSPVGSPNERLAEGSELSYVKLQTEEAVNKGLLPAFGGKLQIDPNCHPTPESPRRDSRRNSVEEQYGSETERTFPRRAPFAEITANVPNGGPQIRISPDSPPISQ